MKSFSLSALSGAFLLLICILGSCTKDEPATPPNDAAYDPELAVTHTIAQLQAMPVNVAIEADVIISGIVVMNDEHGNYFNRIVIQDETGGMEICLHQSNLFKNYPVGRKVYVRCKGLYLGADRQNQQLGTITNERGETGDIPEQLISDFIIKANYPNPIRPDTVTLLTLSSLYSGRPYLNKLVVVKQAEFIAPHMGTPFAQSGDIASATTLTLQSCAGVVVGLRTSGYADFQSIRTPTGNGYITALYSRNNLVPQLTIRNANDVQFNNERCDGSRPRPDGTTPIATLRNLCPDADDSIAALPQYIIAGIVVSDKNGANIAPEQLVLQHEGVGILVRLAAPHNLQPGDSALLYTTGGKLARSNGVLQLSQIPVTAIVKAGTGKAVTPRTLTIADALQHYAKWESSLIRIDQAYVTGYGTYSGGKDLSDATGTLTLYTRSTAAFAHAWPTQQARSYTGLLSSFNGAVQLQLRNLGDVQ